MRRVWVALGCNNACLFCPQVVARAGGDAAFFASAPLLGRLDQAADSGEVVALVGGEPTLRPDLLELIERARQRGARGVVVQTNGRRLAYASYCRALASAGATAVDVSLHGSTAPMHEFHTQAEGSFAQTVTGLGLARGAGLAVGVTAVLTRSNYRHTAEIARLAVARGARALHLSAARSLPSGPPLPSSIVPNAAMLLPYLTEAVRVARGLGAHVLVDGRASHPSLLELFAGPGEAAPPGG